MPFQNMLLVLGGFHIASALVSAIYRRFKGSGLKDLAVAAGMTEPGFGDNAIKCGNCKKGMRIHELIYLCVSSLHTNGTRTKQRAFKTYKSKISGIFRF